MIYFNIFFVNSIFYCNKSSSLVFWHHFEISEAYRHGGNTDTSPDHSDGVKATYAIYTYIIMMIGQLLMLGMRYESSYWHGERGESLEGRSLEYMFMFRMTYYHTDYTVFAVCNVFFCNFSVCMDQLLHCAGQSSWLE